MSPGQISQAALFLVSFVMVGICCGAEGAFVSANRAAVRALAAQGSRNAGMADELLSDREALLAYLLVGINVFTVAASVLAASLSHELWGPAGPAVAAPALVVLILIFGEIVPKHIAYGDPTASAVGLARIASGLRTIFGPVASLFSFVPRWLGRRRALSTEDMEVTQDSLEELLRLGEERGSLPPETGDLVAGILTVGDRPVREIMTPAAAMVAVSQDMPLSEAAALLARSDFSRLPVYRQSPDSIVGTLHAKDAAVKLFESQDCTVGDLVRPVLRVPDEILARDLLTEMRRRRQHMAVVTGPRGSVTGLVTMHDLIEEVIGEINESAQGDKPRRR